MFSCAIFLATVSSLCATGSPRQSAASTDSKIGSIHVTGLKTLTSEQAIAATGLKPGQAFDVQQLNRVAERLGKSGAFSDLTYTYVSQGGLVTVDFKVQEAKLRPCHFDNFVWLPGAEIDARLKRELPLYNGMAPETGEMADEVSRVLEQLSKEKGVSVRVTWRVEEPWRDCRPGSPIN
ncbi:MAG TPA: POTRA domain-containing protein [Candidatus Acidoferrum sp.]|nr:POTRA domain-containing protein [Candidatus Acidoferrum sp.]